MNSKVKLNRRIKQNLVKDSVCRILVFIGLILLAIILRVGSTGAEGEKIVLLSAIIGSSDIEISLRNNQGGLYKSLNRENILFQKRSTLGRQSEDKTNLSFYLPYDTLAVFEVNNFNLQYKMRTLLGRLTKGFYTFSWDNTILNELNLDIRDLSGYGKVGSFIIPVIINKSKLPQVINVHTYSFAFVAFQRCSASIRIVHPESDSIFFDTQIERIYGDKPFIVHWQLEKDSNIPDGELSLLISINYKTIYGNPRRSRISYRFYHKNVLSTSEGKILTGFRNEGIVESIWSLYQ